MAQSEQHSDKRSPSITREFTRLLCDVCLDDGNHEDAEGYCVDCEEYLCLQCFQVHCRPRPFKHHQLLDKQKMPKLKPDMITKDECTEKCKTHKDEIVKYYCEDHQQFGCTVCVTLSHRSCKVGYIPTLSENLFNSQEYKRIISDLDSLLQKTGSIQLTAFTNLQDTKQRADLSFTSIKQLRKEVNDYFDQLEQKITQEVIRVQEENHRTIKTVVKQNSELKVQIDTLKRDIHYKENRKQKCRLFVDIKQISGKIKELENDISTIEGNNRIRDVTFKASPSVKDFIRDKSREFGSLKNFHETFPVTLSSGTKQVSTINGIAVLPDDKIAMIDCTRIQLLYDQDDGIRILDKNRYEIIATQKLSGWLWGITRISDSEIAVPLLNKIEIYSVTDKLTLQRTIRNTGLSDFALVYTESTFIGITTSSPHTLRVVNMNGDTVRTFPTELDGKPLFSHPSHIASNNDQSLIYVSDWGKNTLTCLTLKGEIRAEFSPGSIWSPSGVTVSQDGTVYVCDSIQNNIHILTSDLKLKGVIRGEKYGLKEPQGLAYCDRNRQLYVGMWISEHVCAFNV